MPRSARKAFASSNSPASWPVPGPGRCWPISAPTSSRSRARAAATTPAPGARPSSRTRTARTSSRLLSRLQSRQALDRGRFRDAGRASASCASSRRKRRRADRELQGRRPGEIRPRLREPRDDQPAAGLLLDHRLRPGRPLRGPRRLRLHHPGHGRHHGHHRRAGRRAAEGRRRLRRHLHRPLCGDRHPGGAAQPRPPARAAHRHGAARHDWSACSPTRPELSGLRQVAEAMGNAHPNIAPYQVFPVADGHMLIAGRQRRPVRARLCAILGDPAIAHDERFATNPARVANRGTLSRACSS